MATNTIASRVISTGGDDAGLGRWVWVRFRGKNKTFARIISVYQPHKGSTKLHPKSVYRQQQRYWLDNDSDVCPLVHFQDDLCALITSPKSHQPARRRLRRNILKSDNIVA